MQNKCKEFFSAFFQLISFVFSTQIFNEGVSLYQLYLFSIFIYYAINIEANPGPGPISDSFSFFHLNLKYVSAHTFVKKLKLYDCQKHTLIPYVMMVIC